MKPHADCGTGFTNSRPNNFSTSLHITSNNSTLDKDLESERDTQNNYRLQFSFSLNKQEKWTEIAMFAPAKLLCYKK